MDAHSACRVEEKTESASSPRSSITLPPLAETT